MDTEQLNAFMREFDRESDRAAAILGACLLDTTLTTLLEAFFIQDKKFVEKYILGDSMASVVDSFAKKIRTANAVGLLRPEEYEDLENIRRIRNDFAHELHGLSFQSQSVEQRCSNLKIARPMVSQVLSKGPWVDSARTRYMLSVMVIQYFLSFRAQTQVEARVVWPIPLCGQE